MLITGSGVVEHNAVNQAYTRGRAEAGLCGGPLLSLLVVCEDVFKHIKGLLVRVVEGEFQGHAGAGNEGTAYS